jgi:RNA polymerase sigma-70 factor (ECF subfamily)
MASRSVPAPRRDERAEQALLARLRVGEEAAFETLVRDHGGRMMAVIQRILPNLEDARDALQEAFLAAFRAIKGFGERAQLGTWLHRIAVNAALMKVSALKRRREVDAEQLLPKFTETGGHFLEPPAPWSHSPEAHAQREDLARIVHEAIAVLPENHRQALILRDIEGLSNEEVAREMGVGANAAKIRVHRARMALRALLDPQLREETT